VNEFCTLFDSNYLSRGLALYRSLERHGGDFRLRALCLDEESERLLRRIDADRLEVVPMAELEAHDGALLAAREDRSRVEYYWTATPCLCLFALDREPGLQAITYLDADLLFFDSPGPIFAELGDGSVLLIPHRWADEHSRHEVTGRLSDDVWGLFNVQFMTFRRDTHGMEALRWWRDRCLEFCPALIHPGQFGDQKYLDDWPDRFDGVRVLQHPGAGLAPWNVSRYRVEGAGDEVLVDGRRLIFHHYQGLSVHQGTRFARLMARTPAAYRRSRVAPEWVWTTRWPLSDHVLDVLWEPYVERLSDATRELEAVGAEPYLGTDRLSPGTVAGRLIKPRLPRPLRRTYWRVRAAAKDADGDGMISPPTRQET
jgi:hypothetical protein